MPRDLHNTIHATRGLAPVAATTDNTAYVSQILDTANYESNEFIGICGAIADADTTIAVLLEEGNDSALADNSTVASTDMLGSSSIGVQFDSDNKVFKIGYKGSKRYIRVTLTPSNNTGNLFLAGVWIQGHPRTVPQTSQLTT